LEGTGSLGSGKWILGAGGRGVAERSLPLCEFLGAFDDLRFVAGLREEECNVGGGGVEIGGVEGEFVTHV